MLLDMKDIGQPFYDNRELLEEYQVLIDHMFDNALNGSIGKDDFDITAEVLPDSSMDEARIQLEIHADLLEARERLSSDEIPLVAVMRKLGMERAEKMLFLLLLMPQVSGSCYRAYRRLLKHRGETRFTVGFYFDFLRCGIDIRSDDFLQLLTDAHPLGRFCISRQERVISFSSELRLRDTILRHCADGAEPSGMEHGYFDYYENISSLYGVERYIAQLEGLCRKVEDEAQSNCLVRLKGSKLAGKKSLLSVVAERLGRRLLVVPLEELKKAGADQYRSQLGELQTECFLEHPLVYIEDITLPRKKSDLGAETIQRLLAALHQVEPMIFCCLSDENIRLVEQPYIEVALDEDLSLKMAVWQGVMNEYENVHLDRAEHLASRYSLNAGMIRKAMKQAQLYSQWEGCRSIERRHLEQAVFSSGSIDFEGLATRVPAIFGWDDIELKEPIRRTLELVIKRINFKYQVGEKCGLNKKLAYGKGVNILFYGKPGTGKTMCAQVLAKELGMELYRVDISQLVSKYIGETEKNLAKVFDEAKKGDIILFFDEADSIFSQRTEVNGTNDKHANAEVSFLLQKMEEYPGVAILATNLLKNFDPAVMRRLTYSINFELPDKDTVIKLWKNTLPESVKLDPKIDLEYFADNLELSGSNIKSILYNAAYMAASEGSDELVITAEELVPAIQMEYEKLGEFFNRSNLGPYMVYAKE